MIVDSHCHLDYDNLFDQLNNVVARAIENKIKYLLTISTTEKSFERIQLIIKKYNNIFGTFGIHPHETSKHNHITSLFIKNLIIKNKKIIGVGETGLDYYYNHSEKNIQKKSFIGHIDAARDLNLPVIVHSRNAEYDTLDILKNEKKNSRLKVLVHCFTGDKDFAKKLIDIGCYISISGIVTFKNSFSLVEAVQSIPLANLLVETDSPYLAPMPYRGKVNEPSYIIHTIEKIAKIKSMSAENISNKTTENFLQLFNL
jgi:TatD DNase family protein